MPKGSLPGQLCRIELKTVTAPRLVIPLAAIRNDSLGEYVLKATEENTIDKIRINTGIQISNHVEILSGLNKGDKVVIRGFQGLNKGSKVKIINARKNIVNNPDKPAVKNK